MNHRAARRFANIARRRALGARVVLRANRRLAFRLALQALGDLAAAVRALIAPARAA